MEAFRNQYKIRQGKITLYQRASRSSKPPSDNWNARFNIYGHTAIRRSLKTDNQAEAEIRAEDLYQELLHKSKQGLSLKSKRFGLICEGFLKHLTKQVKQDAHLPKLQQTFSSGQLKAKKSCYQQIYYSAAWIQVRFLSHLLSSGRARKIISDIATGTSGSMKNISKPNLLSIQIPLPPIKEQISISVAINSVDKKITIKLVKLTNIKNIKKALMQALLTGKVRVML